MFGEPSRSTNGQTSLILHLAGAVLAAIDSNAGGAHSGLCRACWAFRACLAALVLLAVTTLPAKADFEDGAAAYQRGDYETAFEEWQSAAEKGDVDAQATLGGAYLVGP